MMSFALSFAVVSSSGALLSGYESKHVRLLDAVEVAGGVVVGQAAVSAPQSLEGLREERKQLVEAMPSLIPPILLRAAGDGLVIVTLAVLAVQRGWFLLSLSTAVIGGILVIIGGVLVVVTIAVWVRAKQEINRIDAQVRRLEAGGGGDLPLPTGPTPPPPPPMSLLNVPEQTLVLATF